LGRRWQLPRRLTPFEQEIGLIEEFFTPLRGATTDE